MRNVFDVVIEVESAAIVYGDRWVLNGLGERTGGMGCGFVNDSSDVVYWTSNVALL